MAKATQLNLTLQNTTGTLARLCRDLADGGVNLLALSAGEIGHAMPAGVRLLVANPDLATRTLTRAGYAFSAEQVLFIGLKNRPGALAKTTEKLDRANIAIRYAYVTAYPKAEKAAAVIAVAGADLERAAQLMAGR
ncbi:MAG: hypothetical protein HYX76_15840 [Acidobacteria bacterium]|nr:hypothetical protein [Acidobacteriota bacterium]